PAADPGHEVLQRQPGYPLVNHIAIPDWPKGGDRPIAAPHHLEGGGPQGQHAHAVLIGCDQRRLVEHHAVPFDVDHHGARTHIDAALLGDVHDLQWDTLVAHHLGEVV